MAGIAEKVFAAIGETVASCGVSLWDVRFVKEGASHYLRVFIDKAEGVSIDDCTDVSHAIDPIIDELDPIDTPYYLEVCSPGIERELSRDEHFVAMLGKPVKIKLFKALDGNKELNGILEGFDGKITVNINGEARALERGQVAKVYLQDLD